MLSSHRQNRVADGSHLEFVRWPVAKTEVFWPGREAFDTKGSRQSRTRALWVSGPPAESEGVSSDECDDSETDEDHYEDPTEESADAANDDEVCVCVCARKRRESRESGRAAWRERVCKRV